MSGLQQQQWDSGFLASHDYGLCRQTGDKNSLGLICYRLDMSGMLHRGCSGDWSVTPCFSDNGGHGFGCPFPSATYPGGTEGHMARSKLYPKLIRLIRHLGAPCLEFRPDANVCTPQGIMCCLLTLSPMKPIQPGTSKPYLYMCVCMCIQVHICICKYVSLSLCIYTCTYTYIRLRKGKSVCLLIHTYIYIYVYAYMCMQIPYTCMCVFDTTTYILYACIYIYT